MKAILKLLTLGAVLAATAPLALASPFLMGQFGVGGAVTPTTTQLQFNGPTIVTGMSTQTGDFVTLLGNAGGVHADGGTATIVFSPSYPGGAFLTFPTISDGDFTIDIDTLTAQIIHAGATTFTVFQGTATFDVAGFADTAGTFSFTTSGPPGTATNLQFAATGLATPPTVPEPSSLFLMGTGLLGAAGAAFRKRRAL